MACYSSEFLSLEVASTRKNSGGEQKTLAVGMSGEH